MYPSWLNSIGRSTKEHSPVILSAVAVAGVAVTAILAVKASRKADVALHDAAMEKNDQLNRREFQSLTPQEVVKTAWTFYIPAGLAGAATIACIIGANKIGARQNAALLAAYTLADQSFKQYKDEVLEQIGDVKERKIGEAVALKQMDNNPPNTEVILVEGSDVLCYDTITGRRFRNDHESIRRAANEIDSRVLHDMYASLNEFYILIGLDPVAIGDELGWNIDRRIELVFGSKLVDGTPCLSIGYKQLPVKDYGKVF